MEEGTSLALAGTTFDSGPVAAADDTVVPPPHVGWPHRYDGLAPALLPSILRSTEGW